MAYILCGLAAMASWVYIFTTSSADEVLLFFAALVLFNVYRVFKA